MFAFGPHMLKNAQKVGLGGVEPIPTSRFMLRSIAGTSKRGLGCNLVPVGPSIDFIAPAYHNSTMLSRMEVNSSL